MRQLMDRIDKHKKVEEDQTQGKGKTKIFPVKGEILDRRGRITVNLGENLLTNHQGLTRK